MEAQTCGFVQRRDAAIAQIRLQQSCPKSAATWQTVGEPIPASPSADVSLATRDWRSGRAAAGQKAPGLVDDVAEVDETASSRG